MGPHHHLSAAPNLWVFVILVGVKVAICSVIIKSRSLSINADVAYRAYLRSYTPLVLHVIVYIYIYKVLA